MRHALLALMAVLLMACCKNARAENFLEDLVKEDGGKYTLVFFNPSKNYLKCFVSTSLRQRLEFKVAPGERYRLLVDGPSTYYQSCRQI